MVARADLATDRHARSAPVTGPVVGADVQLSSTTEPVVGTAARGARSSVDATVETDADRTVVRLSETPAPGTEIAVVANTAPTKGDAIEVGIQPRLIDESATSFGELAEASSARAA